MPKFIGQTDKVLRIQLPSSIVDATWGLGEVAYGGHISLEVQTHWVADDSDIQITIKDLEGNAIEVLKGKVNSSVYLTQFQVKKSNSTGGMFFEVEMKAHKLKAIGPKVRVWPAIKITPRLLDGGEKVISEIEDTKDFTFEAKVQGAPNGSECHFELAVRKSQNHQMRIVGLVAKVKDGKAICHWGGAFPKDEVFFENKTALSKKAENYEVPKYVLIASCMGVKAESAQIPYSSWVEFDFGGRKGKATLIMPDGTEKVKPVSETGILRVDKPKAGQVRLKKFEHEMEEVRVAAVEDEEKHVGMGDLKEVERREATSGSNNDSLLTLAQLNEAVMGLKSENAERFISPLNDTLKKFQINTPLRIAHFLAQLAHESGAFSHLEEIGSDKRFTEMYDPETRAGKNLGNTEIGDGPLFKGRGLIQLTGRWNYMAFGKYAHLDLLKTPSMLAKDPAIACNAAGWFWSVLHKVNKQADLDSIVGVTKIINSGLAHLEHRKKRLIDAKKALDAN